MCFGSGQQTTTSTIELPEWLSRAAEGNVERATDIADRPYAPYTEPRIADFTGDQTAALNMLRDYAGTALMPSGITEQIAGASTAPWMSYSNPRLIDNIPGTDGSVGGSIEDYMNPYIQNVIADTMSEMRRQGDIAQKNIDSSATMAGAFGDTGHAIQSSELERNLLTSMGQQANRGYADAYSSAMGLRESDLNRMLSTFNTNASLYEGALNRAISGGATEAGVASGEQVDLLNYIDALYSGGAKQQGMDQASLDLAYEDFLRQFNYPIEMLEVLNRTTAMQPHGQTTTQTTPTASGASQAIGTGLGIASLIPGI